MYAETPWCMYADFGCKSMEQLGAKYAVVGCMYADVGCKICGCWVHSMQLLGASLWILLTHPSRDNQNQVMCDDAAPEALEPAGSSPKGELTGKPYSSNSIAGTNS